MIGITERRQAVKKRQLGQCLHEGMMSTNAFTRITGYTRDEVLGRTRTCSVRDVRTQAFYAAMWQALRRATGTASCGTGARTASVPELLTISAVRDAQGKHAALRGLFSDITDQGTREPAGAHRALSTR
jgi:PAS domain S-box-containing protein